MKIFHLQCDSSVAQLALLLKVYFEVVLVFDEAQESPLLWLDPPLLSSLEFLAAWLGSLFDASLSLAFHFLRSGFL